MGGWVGGRWVGGLDVPMAIATNMRKVVDKGFSKGRRTPSVP